MRSTHLITRAFTFGLAAVAVAIGLAASATVASAGYIYLLDGHSVSSLDLKKKTLSTRLKAENELEVECEEGIAESYMTLSEEGKKALGSTAIALSECVWVGAEGFCTINDPGAGEGQILLAGNSEVSGMEEEELEVITESEELGTIYTEGAFCTIPEEEELSGSMAETVLDALKDTKVKLTHFNTRNMNLGASQVTEFTALAHESDPGFFWDSTFAYHQVVL